MKKTFTTTIVRDGSMCFIQRRRRSDSAWTSRGTKVTRCRPNPRWSSESPGIASTRSTAAVVQAEGVDRVV